MPSPAHDLKALSPPVATAHAAPMSRPSRQALAWLFALGLLLALSLASLMVGAGDMHWSVLWSRSEDDLASQVLVYSRVPRTLALVLAGASMAVCGLLMQMLARNHFVEPDRKSTRLNSSHSQISYAVFCLKKKKNNRCIYMTARKKNDTWIADRGNVDVH